jgi:hypothetical protein
MKVSGLMDDLVGVAANVSKGHVRAAEGKVRRFV